jgi:predicted RND superfamily exporter protein
MLPASMLEKEGSYTRLFRWIRIPVILIFLAAVVFSLVSLPRLRLDFGFHTLFEHSAELPELMRYKETYGEDINIVIVVVRAKDIFTPAVLRRIAGLTAFADAQPGVERTTSLTRVDVIRSSEDELGVEPFIDAVPTDPKALEALRREALGSRQLRRWLISDDGKVSAVIVELKGYLRNQNALIGAIEGWIGADEAKHSRSGVSYALGGVNVIQREYERVSTQDMISNAAIVIAVMAVFLALVYRSPLGVLMPVLSSLAALALMLGLMAVAGQPINMITQLVPDLIVILGIADGVYLLSRYVEERREHPSGRAFDRTMRAMTVACFFTSVTTIAGFGSCVVAGMYTLRMFGIYIAAGMAISFLAVIFLVPAILSFGSVTAPARGGGRPGGDAISNLTEGFLRAVAAAVTRRPRTIIAVFSVLTVLAAIAALSIKVQHRLLSEIGEQNPVAKANAAFEDSLFGVLTFGIEFEGPPDSMVEPEVLRGIDAVVAQVEKDPQVRKVQSLPQTLKEFNMAWMGEGEAFYAIPATRQLAVQYLEFFDPGLKKQIVTEDYARTRIRIMARNMPSTWWYALMKKLTPILERRFPPGGKIGWRFNGSSHLAAVTLHHLMRDMGATMLTSLAAITLLMTLLFRSWRIGLLSMIPNIIPLVLCAGFMGAVGIDLRPATCIIFAISLGVAVNDTIHLLARYREEILAGAEAREAVVRTIMTAGRPVLITSVMLTLGTIVLARSEFVAVRDFSLLFAVTLVAALACDLLLTTVILLYIGRRVFGGPKGA